MPKKTVLLVALMIAILSSDVAAQSYIFVSSRGTNSVKRYDATTGVYIDDFVPPFSGGLSLTQEVVFGPDGHLYVSGRGNQEIKKYDRDTGAFLDNFTSGYTLDNPTKMTFGPDGDLYVSQWGNTKFNVVRFNGSTGEFVEEATSDGQFKNQMSQAWDDQGRMYVVSFTSRDVRRYEAGNLLDVFILPFQFQGPVNLWFDDSGDLLVADWTRGDVRRFDSNGNFKSVFVSGLNGPEGYAYGPDGLFYLCAWNGNTCNRYDATTGAFVDTFISGGGLLNPNSITFGPPPEPTSSVVADELPISLSLAQNTPNPFSTSTNISFEVAQPGRATLTVYDVRGRVVERLIDSVQPAGIHTVMFVSSTLPPGVYFYRVEAGGQTEVRKMVRF